MIAILAFIAVTADAPSITPKPYDGPVGLRWGMAPDSAKKTLAKSFKLLGESVKSKNVNGQIWRGAFAGETSELTLFFLSGELSMIALEQQTADMKPASKRWAELVKNMTDKYGAPGRIESLPDIVVANEHHRYQVLDLRIAGGGLAPQAQWYFNNGATVWIFTSLSDPDANGVRDVSVSGGFARTSEVVEVIADAVGRDPKSDL